MPPEDEQRKMKASNEAPVPFVVEPTQPHTHTFILLHGLGSNGEKFGTELLDTGINSDGRKLSNILPGARFVFPTSRRRRSSAFGRSVLTQWFDIARLEDPSYRQGKQLQGLCESAQDILNVLEQELQRVPAKNIILGGLSQGCAISMAVLLSLEHPLGGYIGMCGFLTYQADLELAVKENDDDDVDDPFARDGDADDDEPQDPAVKAQTLQRDILGLDVVNNPCKEKTALNTPIFFGHGREDTKVPVSLGSSMAQLLKTSGYQVQWISYEGLGHWYKIPDEIDDIVSFLGSSVGMVFE